MLISLNNFLLSIIIVLFLIIYYILIYLNISYNYENEEYIKQKYIDIETVYNDLKTGDLILFSAQDYSPLNRIFSNLRFSHVGIVIKKNKKKYILELLESDYVYKNNKLYYGVNIFNLKNRIENYCGSVYLAKYNKELDKEICNEFINNILRKHKEIKYATNKQNLLKVLLNKHYNNNYHCAEFISILLDKLNIYSFKKVHKKNIMHQIILLCNSEIYKVPIRIISKKNIAKENKILNYCI